MATFYFNEVLPERSSVDVCAVLETIIINTSRLISKLHMTKSVITSTRFRELCICGMSLVEIISRCRNREVKTQAYHIFTHNVIKDHEDILNEEDIQFFFDAEYKFNGCDAINLAIAQKMDWPILSMPLNEILQKNQLSLTSEKVGVIEAVNYYGQKDTSYIERWIEEKAGARLQGLERFKALFGKEKVLLTREFEKAWNKAEPSLQDLAYERFKLAVDKKILFPVRADDKLIKKMEIKGSKQVYELRQKGQGLRIYFGYSDDASKIIMAGFHTKAESVGTEQTLDINQAARQINKLLSTQE